MDQNKLKTRSVSMLLKNNTSNANVRQLQAQMGGDSAKSNFPRIEFSPAEQILDFLQTHGIDYTLSSNSYYSKKNQRTEHGIDAVLSNSKYNVTLFSDNPGKVGSMFIRSGRVILTYPQSSRSLFKKQPIVSKGRYNTQSPIGYMIANHPAKTLAGVLNMDKSANFQPQYKRKAQVISNWVVPVKQFNQIKTRYRTVQPSVEYSYEPASNQNLNLLRPDVMNAMSQKAYGVDKRDLVHHYIKQLADNKGEQSPELKQDRSALSNYLKNHQISSNAPRIISTYLDNVRNIRQSRYEYLMTSDVHQMDAPNRNGVRKYSINDIATAKKFMSGKLGNKTEDDLTPNEKHYIYFYKQDEYNNKIRAARAEFGGNWYPSSASSYRSATNMAKRVYARVAAARSPQVAQKLRNTAYQSDAWNDSTVNYVDNSGNKQSIKLSDYPQLLGVYKNMRKAADKAVDKHISKQFLTQTVRNAKFYFVRKAFGGDSITKQSPIAITQKHIRQAMKDTGATDDDKQAVYDRLNEFDNLDKYTGSNEAQNKKLSVKLIAAIENGPKKGDKPLSVNQLKLLKAVSLDSKAYVGSYKDGFNPNTVVNLSNEAVGGYMRNYIYNALSTVQYPMSKFTINGVPQKDASKFANVDTTTLSKVEDHMVNFDPQSAKSVDQLDGKKQPFLKKALTRIQNDLYKNHVYGDTYTSDNADRKAPTVKIDKNGVIHWTGYRGVRDPRRKLVNKDGKINNNYYSKKDVPIEGSIGQLFAPDKYGLIHTHFASKDDLTKIPAFKGYYIPNNIGRGRRSIPRMARLRLKGFYQMMNERLDYTVENQLLRQPPKATASLSDPAGRIDLTSARDSVMLNGIYHSEVYGRDLNGASKDYFNALTNGQPTVGRSKKALLSVINTFKRQVHFPKNLDDLESASQMAAKSAGSKARGHGANDLLSGHHLRTIATNDYAGVFDPRQSGNGQSQGINLYLDKGINLTNDIDPSTGRIKQPAMTVDLQTGKKVPAWTGQLEYTNDGHLVPDKNGVQLLNGDANPYFETNSKGQQYSHFARHPNVIQRNANYLARQDLKNRYKGHDPEKVRQHLANVLNKYVTMGSQFYSLKQHAMVTLRGPISPDKATLVQDHKNGHFYLQPNVRQVLAEVHKLDALPKPYNRAKDGTYQYVVPRSPLRSMPAFRYDRFNMGDRSLMAAHYALTAIHSQPARVSLVTTGGFTYDDSCTVSSDFAAKNPQINAFDENGNGLKNALFLHFAIKNHITNYGAKRDRAVDDIKLITDRMSYPGTYQDFIQAKTDEKIRDVFDHTSIPASNYENLSGKKLNAFAINNSQGKINSKIMADFIDKKAKGLHLDQINGSNKLTKFVFKPIVQNGRTLYNKQGQPMVTAHIYDPKIDKNVPYNDIDKVGFNSLGQRLRPLRKGDKMIEYAGNKATIGLVVDPHMPKKVAEANDVTDEVQFYRDNPDVNMTMNAFSVVSRDNTGMIHEMHSQPDKVKPLKLRNPKTGKIEYRGQSGIMNMMVADIPVDTKTQDYSPKGGRGRNVNGQIGWALQALGAHHILHDFYRNNDKAWQHLRNYLNVIGLDLVKSKSDGKYRFTKVPSDTGYVPKEYSGKNLPSKLLDKNGKLREDRQIYTANPSANSRYIQYLGTPDEFTQKMANRSGMLKLPFKIKLKSGVTTDKLTIMDSSLRRNMPSRDGQLVLNDYMSIYLNIYKAIQSYDSSKHTVAQADTLDQKNGTDPKKDRNRSHAVSVENEAKSNIVDSINKLQNKVIVMELGGPDGADQKDSFIRRHIIESRAPYSSTSVVTADPRVRLGHAKVGRRQYRTILSRKDPENGNLPIYRVIARKQRAYKTTLKKGQPKLAAKREKGLDNYKKTHARVLMWRDPALTEGSIRAVQLDMDPSINGVGAAMPPLADNSFEGDFDGDTYGFVSVPHANDPKIQSDMDKISIQRNLINNFGKDPASYLNISMDAVNGAVHAGIVSKTYYQEQKPPYKLPNGQTVSWKTGPDYARHYANSLNKKHNAHYSADDYATGLAEQAHALAQAKHVTAAKKCLHASHILSYLAHANPTKPMAITMKKGHIMPNLDTVKAVDKTGKMHEAFVPSGSSKDKLQRKFVKAANTFYAKDAKGNEKKVTFNPMEYHVTMQPQYKLDVNGKPEKDGTYAYEPKVSAVRKPLTDDFKKALVKSGQSLHQKQGTLMRKQFVYDLKKRGLTVEQNKSFKHQVRATQLLNDKSMRHANFASAYVDAVTPKRFTGETKGMSKQEVNKLDRQAQMASIRNSCDTGAKGNPMKRSTRFGKFDLGLGTRKDLQDVQTAKGTQADLTGIAGSYSQAMYSLLRHKDPVTAIEITHPDTQAVLQIKHNPEQATKYNALLIGPMRDVLVKGKPLKRENGEVVKKNGIPQTQFGLQTKDGFKRDYNTILKQLNISPNPKLLDNLANDLSITDARTHKPVMIGTQKLMQIESGPLDRAAYARHSVAIPSVKINDKTHKAEVVSKDDNNLKYPKYVKRISQKTGKPYNSPVKALAGGVSADMRAAKNGTPLPDSDYMTDAQKGRKPMKPDSNNFSEFKVQQISLAHQHIREAKESRSKAASAKQSYASSASRSNAAKPQPAQSNEDEATSEAMNDSDNSNASEEQEETSSASARASEMAEGDSESIDDSSSSSSSSASSSSASSSSASSSSASSESVSNSNTAKNTASSNSVANSKLANPNSGHSSVTDTFAGVTKSLNEPHKQSSNVDENALRNARSKKPVSPGSEADTQSQTSRQASSESASGDGDDLEK